jgi:hypothetical protein
VPATPTPECDYFVRTRRMLGKKWGQLKAGYPTILYLSDLMRSRGDGKKLHVTLLGPSATTDF